MKILSVDKIREADAYTIANEPILSIDLMERAGKNCYKWIKKKLNKEDEIFVFVGPGNNGGDGLVIARLLSEKRYKVHIVIVNFTDKYSPDCIENIARAKKIEEINFIEVSNKKELPSISSSAVIIDAIFGSGLSRIVDGLAGEAIHHINSTGAIVISIDIPSGLFADQQTDSKKGAIVGADYTLSLQFPKYSFLFAENEFFIGQLHIIDIGLNAEFIESVSASALLIDKYEAAPLLHSRSKFAHKGIFGHALLIAGSYGKMGAAVLSAQACMRSGIGLLTAHLPKLGVNILQTNTPECMISIDEDNEIFSQLPDLTNYNAIGIGPGLGTNKKSQNALKMLIQEFKGPMVLDADALNILSENKTWLSFLPAGSILTPHPKEFDRLVGKSSSSFERIAKQKDFAIKHQVYVILKGAYTCIASPHGKLFFNASGNPGMATAGSGDVLTGIVLSMLAQAYQPLEAALLACYIHGSSADLAVRKISYESLIASDIVDKLGKAFIELR